jgi:hypothetical protein
MTVRANEGAVSDPGLLEKKENTLKKKKSSWFRRNPEEKEHQQALQHKRSTGRLHIPQAWQGLDDRFDKGPRATSSTTAITQPASGQSHRSDSTEFPIRNCVTAASKHDSNNPRKSFLGLFGKKQKEQKTKYPNHLEIQCGR